jgi:hypothetical protein
MSAIENQYLKWKELFFIKIFPLFVNFVLKKPDKLS